MVSDSNYTNVTFLDGSSHLFSYCQKAINSRFGVKLKAVKRGVSISAEHADLSVPGVVSVLGKNFTPSRRLRSSWFVLLFMLIFGSSIAQTAVADIFYTCKTRPVTLPVMANDSYSNSQAYVFNFQSLSSGSLSLSGKNVILTYAAADTVTFQYRIFDPILSSYSSYVTVKAVGKTAINYGGTYTDGTNITTTGCRILTRGDMIWQPSTKAVIQSNTSITLLPGAEIKPGAVLELKIKQQ